MPFTNAHPRHRELLEPFPQLKCKGGDYVPFTGFGCAAGGFPRCPDKNWSKNRQLKCSDGTIVGYAEAIKARLGDGCICSDGKAPRYKKSTFTEDRIMKLCLMLRRSGT